MHTVREESAGCGERSSARGYANQIIVIVVFLLIMDVLFNDDWFL